VREQCEMSPLSANGGNWLWCIQLDIFHRSLKDESVIFVDIILG